MRSVNGGGPFRPGDLVAWRKRNDVKPLHPCDHLGRVLRVGRAVMSIQTHRGVSVGTRVDEWRLANEEEVYVWALHELGR